jgi:hypothetical protein
VGLGVGGVVHGGVHGDEALGGAGRLEPLHSPLPPPHRLVGSLGAVVPAQGSWCSEASGPSRIVYLGPGRYACGHAFQAPRRAPPPRPKARYRVRNWRQYEAGLRRRGDLTLWLDEAAVAGWQAPRRATPGGQARYSDAAVELVLVLRLVFHLALWQAEGFARSVFRLLGRENCASRTTRRSAGEAAASPGGGLRPSPTGRCMS